MVNRNRKHYLDAMGISRWMLRDTHRPQKKSQAESPSPLSLPFIPTSLPDFGQQTYGDYLIVCCQRTKEELEHCNHSSDDGNTLFNAALKATKWPPKQCVLAGHIDDISETIKHTQAKIIICMGVTAVQQVLKTTEVDIATMRQRDHLQQSTPVVVSYHPALMTVNAKYKRPIWQDLQLAINKMSSDIA